MQRCLYLMLLLLIAACSTKTSGKGQDESPASDDDAPSAIEAGVDGGQVGAVDEAGIPIDPPVEVDGGATPPPPPNKPPPFVSFGTMVAAMRDDIRRIENPAERKDIRYLLLNHLGNAGLSNAQIAVHHSTMSLLVNSLSRGSRLVAPVQLEAAPNVYRINLRDYRWTPEQWEAIVADYPYQVQYNQDSKVYPLDESSAVALREATGTKIPFVFIEWFTNKVVRAPLYYQLLNFPDTLAGLGDQVDVDIAGDIAEQRIARAGVSKSGFATQNRMLERHERIGNAGTFWLSYDFDQSTGVQDIFSHPFDFSAVGGEVIYALPNGLSAYMVVDTTGKRLDGVPFALGADTLAGDGVAVPGLSCMGSCHYAQGFEGLRDEVRTATLNNAPVGIDLEQIRAVFPTQDKLDALLESDRKGYIAAAATLGVDLGLCAAPYQTVELYRGDVNFSLAAALLEVTEKQLDLALQGAPVALPSQIRSLRDGKVVTRQIFESLFAQTVCTLGIGQPLCAAKECGCATLAP